MTPQKFVLPEGRVEIDFEPHMWELLERDVLPSVNTSGLVSLNTGDQAKITLSIEGSTRITRETYDEHADRRLNPPAYPGQNYFDHVFVRLMLSMFRFMLIDGPNWIMWGYVNRKSGGKVPVMILYSETLKQAFYSMKRDSDTDQPPGQGNGFEPWKN